MIIQHTKTLQQYKDWASKQWLRSETKKDPDRILFWMLVASLCVYIGWRFS